MDEQAVKMGNEQGRVLLTGQGNRLIDDFMTHMSVQYTKEKCLPEAADLGKGMARLTPHALIICMKNETREMLRIYELLEDEKSKYYGLPVLVIGKEEECELFKHSLVISNLHVFPRPVETAAVLRFLQELLEAQLAQEQAERQAAKEKSAAQLAQNEELADDGAAPEAPLRRESILVVDDDVNMLNTIKYYLQALYDVTVVPNGKLALKYLEKKKVDLVLLDYMMPDMDGPHILQEIRTNSPNPRVPVLFLTGVADERMVKRGLAQMPNGYLLKPVDRELLLARVVQTILEL